MVFAVDITQDKKRRKKLKKMNNLMVEREKKMIELKEEIEKLKN